MVDSGNYCSNAVDVHFVNYFSARLLEECIASLGAEKVRSIRVLDNSCHAEEWELLLELFGEREDVELVRSDRNVGFGVGHNLLVESSTADESDFIWLLNPDMIVQSGATEVLRSLAKPRVIVSPIILSARDVDSGSRVWFYGGTWDADRGDVRHNYYGNDPSQIPERGLISTAFMTGAAPFMQVKTFHLLGGFDASLFLYWEDVDLSLRASRLGVELLVTSDAIVTHLEGGSSGGSGSKNFYYWSARNRMLVGAREKRLFSYVAGRGASTTFRFVGRPIRAGDHGSFGKAWAAFRGVLDGTRLAISSKLGFRHYAKDEFARKDQI